MTEGDIISETPAPRTRASLAYDLRSLGVQPGMTLIVHSSLRSLGWVSGGPVAVVQALMDVLTEHGTLVMPTQTGNYSDPAFWNNPPVPASWLPLLYEAIPAFDPLITPSYLMGAIVETFRTWPGTLRSNHPIVSFAAWGEHAALLTAAHALDYGLGEQSPLARMYELAGSVLLLGVDYDRNTSFHLAEYRSPGAVPTTLGSPIFEQGQRVWKHYNDIEIDSDLFPAIGSAFELTGDVLTGLVGSAHAKLFPQRSSIDFAVDWFKYKRQL